MTKRTREMWWMPISKRSRNRKERAMGRRGRTAPFFIAIVLLSGIFTLSCYHTWAEPFHLPASPCEPADKVYLVPDRHMEPLVFARVRNAREDIHIGVFLFKCGGHCRSVPARLARALTDAKGRGVRVWVLLERPKDSDSEVGRENPRCARLLKSNGIEVHMESPSTRSHMKAMVVDGRYVLLGSHNFTQSAFRYNHELSVLIESPCLAKKVIRYLEGIK